MGSDDVDALSTWSILDCISERCTKQYFAVNWNVHTIPESIHLWLTHPYLSFFLYFTTDSICIYSNVYTPQTISSIIRFRY